ncbi:hypothetical protein BU17DRAFT_81436 [Hysterangium stoloniferum]|nr:hypothetical protein BU17DRAFT_81436 [Hysterangium stoloniferum]
MSLAHISAVYSTLLAPIPPFTWFGATVSTLDALAVLRLCLVMRQIREEVRRKHHTGKAEVEADSFPKHAFVTLVVVYGGEALSAAWLSQTPSFLVSGTFPLLYTGAQYLVESVPSVPRMSFELEGPLTALDALTRSYLLTSLIPPVVLTHTNSSLANSPWTLLVISFITANGGFFFVNLLSMFHPNGWSLATPAELKIHGWTTVDLWLAPLITGLTALLMHAQPFWAHLHISIMEFMHPFITNDSEKDFTKPWSINDARSFAACIIWVFFATRATKDFGIAWWTAKPKRKEVMRSKIDGRRYPGAMKKTQ